MTTVVNEACDLSDKENRHEQWRLKHDGMRFIIMKEEEKEAGCIRNLVPIKRALLCGTPLECIRSQRTECDIEFL